MTDNGTASPGCADIPTPARRERGAAALEFVGILPILLLAALGALQVGVAGWTVAATADAARSGARAVSLDLDPHAAARGALPGSLTPMQNYGSGTGDGYRHTVEVRIPSLLPGVSLPTVTRSSEMPNIQSGATP